MTYSYTQISQYLSCPRRYRHRYLDGWKEKDTRAAMLFGRVFEQALSAYFRREDSAAVLFKEWAVYQNGPLEYSNGTTWDRMLQQGVQLLERLLKTTAFASARPGRTCRSSSRGRFRKVMSSLPTWTRSDTWTARPA